MRRDRLWALSGSSGCTKSSGSHGNLFRASRRRWEGEIQQPPDAKSPRLRIFNPPPTSTLSHSRLKVSVLRRLSGVGWPRSGLNLFRFGFPSVVVLQKMASSPSCFCLAAAGRGVLSESWSSLQTPRLPPRRGHPPPWRVGLGSRGSETEPCRRFAPWEDAQRWKGHRSCAPGSFLEKVAPSCETQRFSFPTMPPERARRPPRWSPVVWGCYRGGYRRVCGHIPPRLCVYFIRVSSSLRRTPLPCCNRYRGPLFNRCKGAIF